MTTGAQMVKISEARDAPALSRARDADWPAVLFFIHIHLLSLYGVWLLLFEVKLMTILLCEFFFLFCTEGHQET